MDHLVNWIEIPCRDISRARRFYEALLGVNLSLFEQGGRRYAMFPSRNSWNVGALVEGQGYVPSNQGTLIYLDATGTIDAMVERVRHAGGQVLMDPARLSAETGVVALFLDSEGNRIGLQAAIPDSAPVGPEHVEQLMRSTPLGIAFLIRRGPSFGEPTAPVQLLHAQYMLQLLKSGKLRSVTAFIDGTDVLGVGLWDGSRAEAIAALDADPGVRAARITYDLLTDATFAAGAVGL